MPRDFKTLPLQRDALTEQWRQRFLAANADLTYLDKLTMPISGRAQAKLSNVFPGYKHRFSRLLAKLGLSNG